MTISSSACINRAETGKRKDAPIIADTAAGEVHYISSYWYIGHFSRFVPPGALSNSALRTHLTGSKGHAFILMWIYYIEDYCFSLQP